MTLGGELIGVSSNDIFGAEKAAKDDTTPREGEPGEVALEDEGGGVPEEVEAILEDEESVVEDDDVVLSVERAGTVGAVR